MNDLSYLTALPPSSRPSMKLLKWVKANFPNPEGVRILDYGAGNGRHVKALKALGYEVQGYDLHHSSELVSNSTEVLNGYYHLSFSAFVLNVVDRETQAQILEKMEAISTTVVHLVREDQDIKTGASLKGDGEAFITKKGTYQRLVKADSLPDYRREGGCYVKG